jgi:methylmalonyl-CoA/ethylmalonyl-CoA epimerase
MLTRIDHVGVAVRDLEAAIALYENVFGVHVVHQEVNEEQGVREAMLAVGDSGSYIQLLAPLSDDSPIGKFLARHGEGIQQVAYGVADIDAASAELRAAGVRLLYDEPRRGTRGSRINFIHPKDAGGVLVELVESPQEGRAAPGEPPGQAYPSGEPPVS